MHPAEQALLSRYKRALAVDVDGAAFQHYSFLSEHGLNFACTRGFCHQASNFVVALPVGIFGPGIELPFHAGQLCCMGGDARAPPCRYGWGPTRTPPGGLIGY